MVRKWEVPGSDCDMQDVTVTVEDARGNRVVFQVEGVALKQGKTDHLEIAKMKLKGRTQIQSVSWVTEKVRQLYYE